AGHCRRFQRNYRIQLPLANHHAAGMLSEMPWQILETQTELEKFADPLLAHIEAGDTELRFKSVRFILVFEMSDKPRQALQCFHIKTEHLSDFARSRAAAIGDDIRRHGSTQLAVPVIYVLNRALPLIAARKIQIDVGPF